MSRYYSIELYAPNAPAGSTPVYTWTSFPNGVNDPGALNIELDLLTAQYGIPNGQVGNSTVTIEGIALPELRQAQQFTGLQIIVRGGMKAGLPLANPLQAGILLSGTIYQSFGNWQGIEMNLNFVVTPTGYTAQTPGHFLFTWESGQSLGSALTNTLSIAYPDYALQMSVANTYTPPGGKTVQHYSKTFTAFAQFINALLKGAVQLQIIGGATVLASDFSYQPAPKNIAFTDLIGQPAYINVQTMQITTVMRADLQIGSLITMPKGLQDLPGVVTVFAQSLPSQAKYQTTFQGTFQVVSTRHIGNFRDANGLSWCSIFQAVPLGVLASG